MDLLRSSVKSLFYDYPLPPLSSHVLKEGKDGMHFYQRFSELMKWRESSFSSTETGILRDILTDEWMKDESLPLNTANLHPYEGVFLCVEKCASKLLNICGGDPSVRFRHLLRWRDLTMYVSEDLLILTALAHFDSVNTIKNRCLLWEKPLGHDDIKINALLSDTLSDTHAHLNASTDVFEFNWITAMNHPEILGNRLEGLNRNNGFLEKGCQQDYDPIYSKTDINLSLFDWIRLAAWLRLKLFDVSAGNIAKRDEKEIYRLPVASLTSNDIEIILTKTKSEVSAKRDMAFINHNGFVFDYAITNKMCGKLKNAGKLSSPYVIHQGERGLIYGCLKLFFSNNRLARKMMSRLYLYILIKNKIRREFIQTNSLRGFRNFKDYQDYKEWFLSNSYLDEGTRRSLRDISEKYIVQTSLGTGSHKRYFETRVMPGQMDSLKSDNLRTSIFDPHTEVLQPDDFKRLSLVVHFPKASDNEKKKRPVWHLRHATLRDKLNEGCSEVFSRFARPYSDIPVVGIDAAGSEIGCPPEIFAPIYRKASKTGIGNLTYHVGEDFYDIVHGIRVIEEAITFLGLTTGSRIGHALALGVDAADYYCKRHYVAIMPRQEMLDNIVWLRFKAKEADIDLSPRVDLMIEKRFCELTEELHYPQCTPFEYWQSMRLRGEVDSNGRLTPGHKMIGKRCEDILNSYLFDRETFIQGSRTSSFDLPAGYACDVAKLQEYILGMVEKYGVTIEANPSSNLKIGAFGKYEDLPIFKFHTVGERGHKLAVSINTDDKGIFATSLENEFSLIAIALRKMKDNSGKRIWDDRQIEDYLRRIAYYGNITRFRK